MISSTSQNNTNIFRFKERSQIETPELAPIVGRNRYVTKIQEEGAEKSENEMK